MLDVFARFVQGLEICGRDPPPIGAPPPPLELRADPAPDPGFKPFAHWQFAGAGGWSVVPSVSGDSGAVHPGGIFKTDGTSQRQGAGGKQMQTGLPATGELFAPSKNPPGNAPVVQLAQIIGLQAAAPTDSEHGTEQRLKQAPPVQHIFIHRPFSEEDCT